MCSYHLWGTICIKWIQAAGSPWGQWEYNATSSTPGGATTQISMSQLHLRKSQVKAFHSFTCSIFTRCCKISKDSKEMINRGRFRLVFITVSLKLLVLSLQMCLQAPKDTGAQGQQFGSVVDELDQSSLGQQAPLDWRDLLHPSWARNQALAQLQRRSESKTKLTNKTYATWKCIR